MMTKIIRRARHFEMLTPSKIFAFLLVTVVGSGCTQIRPKPLLNSGLTAQPENSALAFASNAKFGSKLTKFEKQSLSAAERKALEFGRAGEPVTWNSDQEGVTGRVIVSQPFRVGKSNCRRFSHEVAIKNSTESIEGTACRRNNGSWKLIE